MTICTKVPAVLRATGVDRGLSTRGAAGRLKELDGGPAFLMAFETDEATVYQVRARHRNEEVREVVPSDYGGVMVTDRGRSYDAQALSGVKQQKCLAHVLRSISEVVGNNLWSLAAAQAQIATRALGTKDCRAPFARRWLHFHTWWCRWQPAKIEITQREE